jgi:hypothetical protein
MQSKILNLDAQHPWNTIGDNTREIMHTAVPLRIDHKNAWDPATESDEITNPSEMAGDEGPRRELYTSTVTGGKTLEKKNPFRGDTISANIGVCLGIQVHLPTLGTRVQFFPFPWS